ncbi:hypothetical protein Tdes44962_MAKER05509 [Teratosphaeria destructans]|uniref:Uncharacterized protein n=1 Tax=Teratosphaeria destructans TaxID=418781 RepID=A0A9W7VYL2_9PEZI|nr:hypothetical protein Tdes44962_MAKER05509 [Teratosphaeria destructans]
MELDASLDSLSELWDVGVAWIEAGASVDDANNGSRQGVFAIAGRFDEDFTEEETEMLVAIAGQARA